MLLEKPDKKYTYSEAALEASAKVNSVAARETAREKLNIGDLPSRAKGK
jgi:hypothetical protein